MFQGDILEPIYRRANPPPALNPTRVEALCVINFVADETFRCSDAPVPEGNYLSMLLSDVTYPMRYRIAILHQYLYRMTAQGHLQSRKLLAYRQVLISQDKEHFYKTFIGCHM